ADLHHVEVERHAARFILDRIDEPDPRVDARALEVARKQESEALFVAVQDHDLEAERPAAAALDQIGSAQLIACGGEQRERAPQKIAVAPGAVADRRGKGAVEHIGTNRIRKWRQQGALARFDWFLACGEFRAFKIARAAPEEAVKEVLVDPFEIEQERKRFAYADV